MLVSYKWLQEYVEIPWSVSKLSNKLTDTGLEVKALEKNPHSLKNTNPTGINPYTTRNMD